jgi:putative two-component system response regulator
MFDTVTILAVDDDSMNLEMLEVMLSDLDCKFLKASNGLEAFNVLKADSSVDVVLLDLEMPVMNGYEAITLIKQHPVFRDIPVIVVTSGASEVARTLSLGANDFLSKPFNPEELRLRVMNHIRSKKFADLEKNTNAILGEMVAKKSAALQQALDQSRAAEYEISLRLGRAAEFRDQETGMHTRRISELSFLLAQLAGISEKKCEIIRFASPLHDVGKIGIPDKILLKPGKLDFTEFEIMKQHTVIGEKILSKSERYTVLEAGSIIALQHHEKWDGSGYPNGLKGVEIDIFARIVSIADVFDALLSERPYKKAFTLEVSLGIMEEGRGVFFDPNLLELFLTNSERFVQIREQLKDQMEEEIYAL